MRRATTPTHTFLFDVDAEALFDFILITYAQNDRIILEKTKDDLTFGEPYEKDGETAYPAYVRLSQDETRRFSPSKNAMVQVRAVTSEDEALASAIMPIAIKDVLNSEVLE